MNQLQAEMKRIRDLLPTELFEGSKDWREGNTVERIEWLLSMYESSKQEVERLEDELITVNQYWHDRT
jgi:ATP-dependent protease HslVU (ClpYQ) peptidase subunit